MGCRYRSEGSSDRSVSDIIKSEKTGMSLYAHTLKDVVSVIMPDHEKHRRNGRFAIDSTYSSDVFTDDDYGAIGSDSGETGQWMTKNLYDP